MLHINQYTAQLLVLIIFKIYKNLCLEKSNMTTSKSNESGSTNHVPHSLKQMIAECKANLDSLKNENGTRESPILYGVEQMQHIGKQPTTLIYHTKEDGLYFQYNLFPFSNKLNLPCVDAMRKQCPATLQLTLSSQGKIELWQARNTKTEIWQRRNTKAFRNHKKKSIFNHSINRDDPKVRDIKNYTVLTPKQSAVHAPSCGYQVPIQDRLNKIIIDKRFIKLKNRQSILK